MNRFIKARASRFLGHIKDIRKVRRWRKLRSMGMSIGKGVNLPLTTWIDMPHCFLIEIGDNCGFGEYCAIIAHDALANEFLDATKIGRVKIHESCHFGMRTVILPGVEIGPRVIVGANSVVATDIPPNTVATGIPARVACSLEEYLAKHRRKIEMAPIFPYEEYSIQYLTPLKLREMIEKLDHSDGYVTGGYTAMVQDPGCLLRTD